MFLRKESINLTTIAHLFIYLYIWNIDVTVVWKETHKRELII